MDQFGEFVNVIVTLDLIAVGIAGLVFLAGTVIAPVAILVRGAGLWRHRVKWAVVAMFTSWLGLWRDESPTSRNLSDPR
jgi:hypothetical protein